MVESNHARRQSAPAHARPFRYEWDGTLRRLKLSRSVKLIAAYVSQYADTQGRHVRPGIERLALETGYNEKTVRRALAELRKHKLLERVRSGSSQGRRGKADEYKLTIPDDLLERVDLVTTVNLPPVEKPTGDDENTGHLMSGDTDADGQPDGQEHRTSSVHCSDGSPDISDRNTGHQMSTHEPETTPADTTTPDNYSLTSGPLTPRETDLAKPNSILGGEKKPHLRLVTDDDPPPIPARRGLGFCVVCYGVGKTVLAADPDNGSECTYHLQQQAS